MTACAKTQPSSIYEKRGKLELVQGRLTLRTSEVKNLNNICSRFTIRDRKMFHVCVMRISEFEAGAATIGKKYLQSRYLLKRNTSN